MSLLVDVFGYLSIVLHGLSIAAQSFAIGGVLFLVALARPFASRLAAGPAIVARTARVAGWAALGLVLCEALILFMQVSVLVDTVGIGPIEALGAPSSVARLIKLGCGLALGLALLPRIPAPGLPLLALSLIELCAATATTHAAARLSDNTLLLGATFLHILGAAIWIGGIPCFIAALRRVQDPVGWRMVGARFSRMSMAGVACILASATVFAIFYIGAPDAIYGTAYGVMVAAKAAMLGALLLLGLGNFLVVERLRDKPGTSVLRMKRFAEVEVGIGLSIFFAAASLTSVPPSVDLTADRVSWHEVVERNTPHWPRLQSPDKQSLALLELQAQLDREDQAKAPPPALTPGSGELPPRNANDIAWSEYNHHWSGIFVVAIAVLALAYKAGVRWAKHWPLVFLGLAVFLLIRSDPEVWPLGPVGFWEGFRDVEVLQHRMFVVLIAGFAFFEWGVRTGRITVRWASYVFPLLTAAGGALLLTHSHAISNVKDQLLIELTHTPLALAGVGAGWARWLELRLDGRAARIAGWVWPFCFLFVGLLLLTYREA